MSRDLWDLLHAGDWACAHADAEALQQVCGHIAACVSIGQRYTAEFIGRLAEADLDAASSLWGHFADRVRADLSGSPLPP